MVPDPISAHEKHENISRKIFYASKTGKISEVRLKIVDISIFISDISPILSTIYRDISAIYRDISEI